MRPAKENTWRNNGKVCGFGLLAIAAEGEATHPDYYDNIGDASDEWYLRQLQAYKDWAGDNVYETYSSRPELLRKLK